MSGRSKVEGLEVRDRWEDSMTASEQSEVLSFGSMVLDLRSRVLLGSSKSVELTRGECRVAAFLCSSAGAWVNGHTIAEMVFGRTDPAGRTLAYKYISSIRIKLGTHANLLEHRRTFGYRLVASK